MTTRQILFGQSFHFEGELNSLANAPTQFVERKFTGIRNMQEQLNERYRQFRQAAKGLLDQPEISPPLLLRIPCGWVESPCRVMVVGQETQGWGLSERYHNRPFGPCEVCPHKESIPLKGQQKVAQPIDALLHVYEIFNFAETQPATRRSPFWRAFRELKQTDGKTCFIWSNLYRVDFKEHSVLGAPESTQKEIREAQRGLLSEELRILAPRIVVFFTGPNYDNELKAEFPGIKFCPVENSSSTRSLARLEHPRLPHSSFRTYHPNYLQISGNWGLVKYVGNLIRGAARSDAGPALS